MVWEVPNFCDLLPVVVGLYNDMHDNSLAPEDIWQIRYAMSTFKGQSLLQVYKALNRLTTCVKESDEGPASVARVVEALRTDANLKTGSTKGINCHALTVATIIVYTFNCVEGGQNISVLASCDRLQIAYDSKVLLLRGENTAHFAAAGQYEISPQQLAFSLIPAMSSGEISEQHRAVLLAHADRLCPWMLLDLAHCSIDRPVSEQFYEKSATMVLDYPAILGPELTWYLRKLSAGRNQLEQSGLSHSAPHRFVMKKLELLAGSVFKDMQVDHHTTNMIRDVRIQLSASGTMGPYLAELDSKLVLLNLPTYLKDRLPVAASRRKRSRSERRDVTLGRSIGHGESMATTEIELEWGSSASARARASAYRLTMDSMVYSSRAQCYAIVQSLHFVMGGPGSPFECLRVSIQGSTSQTSRH